MLNTRDLEERWLKYKVKSYIPHAIITISLTVIVIVISTVFNSTKEKKETIATPKVKIEKKLEKDETVVVQVAKIAPVEKEIIQVKKIDIQERPKIIQTTSKSDDETLKLTPSLDFMKKMQHSSLPYYQEEVITQQEVNNNTQIVEEVQELDIDENTQTAVIEVESKKISIKRRDSQDDIRHIIKRFKKNNNPALSLFVAKKYYELGEYHKAYNYALITNEIDRDIEASWIIFAKSLVKLNQKEMAIKTLQKYIENSHSSNAKILLDEILAGKFK